MLNVSKHLQTIQNLHLKKKKKQKMRKRYCGLHFLTDYANCARCKKLQGQLINYLYYGSVSNRRIRNHSLVQVQRSQVLTSAITTKQPRSRLVID